VTDFDRYMDNLTDPVQLRRIAKEARDELALYRDTLRHVDEKRKDMKRELEELRSAARQAVTDIKLVIRGVTNGMPAHENAEELCGIRDRLGGALTHPGALIPETEETPK
jgi:hypothetical protein